MRVRALGFQPIEKAVEVAAGQTAEADFSVTSAPVSLDEVVVTGTAGSARKREVGNSIGQIKLSDAPEVTSTVSSLLTGKVAGVSIAGNTGNSGSGAAIRLRGTTSVALSNQPLIYVDGVRTRSDEYPRNGIFTGTTQRGANAYGSPINDINPEDIERIEIVKGAAAATLYGTDAAAGVIVLQRALQLLEGAAEGQAHRLAARVEEVDDGDMAAVGHQRAQAVAGRAQARSLHGHRRHRHRLQRYLQPARAFGGPDLEVVRQPGGRRVTAGQQGEGGDRRAQPDVGDRR